MPTMTAIEYVKDSEGKDTDVILKGSLCVFPVTGNLQEFHLELFEEFELVDNYEPKKVVEFLLPLFTD